ncbi:MAG: hypothetical protein AABY06_01810 [Nanoarchaeota archaeon]
MRKLLLIFLLLVFILVIIFIVISVRQEKPEEQGEERVISGYVRDCSFKVGENVSVLSAKINYGIISTLTSDDGYFSIKVRGDPKLLISADGYHNYKEKPSRMVDDAFYLIPDEVYKDLYTANWEIQKDNTNNWMRKWTRQPEIIVAKENGTDEQVNIVISALQSDVFNKMTGGLYSSENITLLDRLPQELYEMKNRDGKIIIYFAEKMMHGYSVDMGGSAYSGDNGDGNITFAESVWNPLDNFTKFNVYHELAHVVNSGGHINYKPSIITEVEPQPKNGEPTEADYKFLNCVYNSPLKRNN